LGVDRNKLYFRLSIAWFCILALGAAMMLLA